jgi:hypothetical protein
VQVVEMELQVLAVRLELADLVEQPEHQVLLVRVEQLEEPVQAVLLVVQEQMVLRDHLEPLVHPERLVLMVLVVVQVRMVLADPQELLDLVELKVLVTQQADKFFHYLQIQ